MHTITPMPIAMKEDLDALATDMLKKGCTANEIKAFLAATFLLTEPHMKMTPAAESLYLTKVFEHIDTVVAHNTH